MNFRRAFPARDRERDFRSSDWPQIGRALPAQSCALLLSIAHNHHTSAKFSLWMPCTTFPDLLLVTFHADFAS